MLSFSVRLIHYNSGAADYDKIYLCVCLILESEDSVLAAVIGKVSLTLSI